MTLQATNNPVQMLVYPRPHGSKTERVWRERFILSQLDCAEDQAGNLFYQVGDNPRVLFSSHTDTVHKTEERYTVQHDAEMGLVYTGGNTCLGADDGVGVYLMVEMALAGVPGLYIFHAGEEKGGIGSAHIARNTPSLLDGIDIAVAFDRKGVGDVITHQGVTRCASDTFAQDLAARLGGEYQPDDGGVFTDTANYDHLVSECTNISVGYYREHTAHETQDLEHLEFLRQRCLEIDWHSLPVVRDPDEIEYLPLKGFTGGKAGSSGDYGAGIPDFGDFGREPADRATLGELVWHDPEAAVDLLMDFGATYEDIADVQSYALGNR